MPPRRDARQIRQALARRHAELQLDEVEARHHLGHGVLHLEARVHLEEEEVPARVGDELARPRAHVADVLHDAQRRLEERPPARLARLAREEGRRRRRLLDDLLVAPLHAALALAERVGAAVRVAEHLHLDVPRLVDVALEVDARVGEGRLARGPSSS